MESMIQRQGKIRSIELIMTVIRPLVNVDEWSTSAKRISKDKFLASAGEPQGGKNTRRIAQNLRKRRLQINWEDLLDAYMALVNEFADWYYSECANFEAETSSQPQVLYQSYRYR